MCRIGLFLQPDPEKSDISAPSPVTSQVPITNQDGQFWAGPDHAVTPEYLRWVNISTAVMPSMESKEYKSGDSGLSAVCREAATVDSERNKKEA